MSKKTLRFDQFVAMSPDEKMAQRAEHAWVSFQCAISRFKKYIQDYHDGFSETDWGHQREPLSFDDAELRILARLILDYRSDPCLEFARSPQNQGDARLPQNTGEVLLKLMRKYHGLIFGYRDRATSKFIEGVMARIQDTAAGVDEIDLWLCLEDFRGKTMFDLLERCHTAGFKAVSQDFLEKRIERLLNKG